jgi:alanine racemase
MIRLVETVRIDGAGELSAGSGERISRPNRAEVDLGAIRDNTRILKDLLGAGTTLFSAVKSNGYGLGLPAVAEAMLAGGCDGFTLSEPADAIRIRDAGIKIPILLYGGVFPSPAAVAEMHRLGLMCTVTDADTARAYSAANSSPAPLGVFAKIDVGLERLGTYPEQGIQFIRTVMGLPGIRLAGIYSHIHGSEAAAYREWQLGRFDRLLRELQTAGIEIPLRMSESSASLGLEAGSLTNAADPGHLLYGIAPVGRPSLPGGIRPAFRALKSRLIQVKDFRRGEFQAQAPVPVGQVRRIGVMPIGRADGLQYLTTGRVRVRGQLVPIIGRLSLEHARLDLTAVPGSRAGDEVEIIGGRPGTEISANAVAAAGQLDQVGLLVAIGPSIPRVYLEDMPGS